MFKTHSSLSTIFLAERYKYILGYKTSTYKLYTLNYDYNKKNKFVRQIVSE